MGDCGSGMRSASTSIPALDHKAAISGGYYLLMKKTPKGWRTDYNAQQWSLVAPSSIAKTWLGAQRDVRAARLSPALDMRPGGQRRGQGTLVHHLLLAVL